MTFTWTDDRVYVTASAQNSSFELNVVVDLEPSDVSAGTPSSETTMVPEPPTQDDGLIKIAVDSAKNVEPVTQGYQNTRQTTMPSSVDDYDYNYGGEDYGESFTEAYQSITFETTVPSTEYYPETSGSGLRIPVRVTWCDQATNHVTVKAFGYKGLDAAADTSSLSPDMEYRVVPTGGAGQFEIVVPATPANSSEEVAQTVCDSVSRVVEGTCAAFFSIPSATGGTICNEVANAAQFLTTHTDVERTLVLAACSGGFGVVHAFCDTIGFNATEEEASSDLCEMVTGTVDSFSPEPVLVVPKAVFSTGEEVSVPGMVVSPGNVNKTLPVFSISYRSAHVISNVRIRPRDPAPGENYRVRATFVCTDDTTVATIEIVGSDDYRKRVQCTGAISKCILTVPGGDELVRDRVTITLSSDGMQDISKEYIISF
ncbi:uncharacterized protein LOC118432188 [Branchiostoma floridae]|uniref:Uncharacterized protein LOC118432188 n=1 Tax=Branchiostoma floridae TaxID=7739 RepID=A0A9J7MHL5_BRAFL|nr:uncharacterized protein LOC118432188 [Branchiostoma floridae]